MPCLPGFSARPNRRETRRRAVPTLLAPQRRSPVTRLSPGFVRRRRRTRRVRRLTLTEPYGGVPAPERRSNRPMRCHASPASTPHILTVTPRMGRLSRHYSSSSAATLPHGGALRHEPVMRPTTPEPRATHGVAAPVTNFGLREISDRGRSRSRPRAPATAPGGAAVPPSERHRPGVAAAWSRRHPCIRSIHVPVPACAPAVDTARPAVLRTLNKRTDILHGPGTAARPAPPYASIRTRSGLGH